jgi:hypothetical protein
VRCGEDPVQRLLRFSTLETRVVAPHSYLGRRPVEMTFNLEPLPVAVNPRLLEFNWLHRSGCPLPSLTGTIAVNRFGPFCAIVVEGVYDLCDDVVGRLLDDVGGRLAKKSLRHLVGALRVMLQHNVPVRDRA